MGVLKYRDPETHEWKVAGQYPAQATNPGAAAVHAAQHATDGSDPITPDAIGAVAKSGGTVTGELLFDVAGQVFPALHAGNIETAGLARIATGSYTGAGGYGTGSPNTLTFDFVPKFVVVKEAASDTKFGGYCWLSPITHGPVCYPETRYVTITWDGKTIRWYNAESSIYQLNRYGVVYHYVAIG